MCGPLVSVLLFASFGKTRSSDHHPRPGGNILIKVSLEKEASATGRICQVAADGGVEPFTGAIEKYVFLK